jgi:predicted RNase H-like HicB family nuclease
MSDTINLEINLRAFVRRDTDARWIATCPAVGVVSQGNSVDDARRCIREAVELWFESCVERGVLDQALREANFRPSAYGHERSGGDEPRSPQRDVLGDNFLIHVMIPAYEAPVLSTTA